MKSIISNLARSLKEDKSDINRKYWMHHITTNDIPLIDLVELVHQEHPVAMRFIWLVGDLCESRPAIIHPAISYFYSKRREIKIPNFDRSLAKMFWLSGIPEEMEGEVIDELFKWLLDPGISVSTKNYSLFALSGLTKKYPELKNELKSVIEDQLSKNSSSFEKRAKKVLEKLRTI